MHGPSRFSLVAVAIATLAAACGSKPPPRRPGQEYVEAIEVEGNQQLKDKGLVDGLALKRAQKRGRSPDPYLIQVDADRIRGNYLRKGYLGIDVRSRVERDGDAATVIYSVDEGLRATTRVEITGLPPDVPVEAVRAALPLADGAPFDYATYDAAKPSLMAVLLDAGYAHVRLDALVLADRANQIATVRLAYTPGPKCTFGDVTITGVDGELAEAVRARLHFQRGQVYSTRAISATQRQLYALQRFSTVQVQPAAEDSEAANPVVDMRVAVSQAARHEIKLGGGFGVDPTAYEVRGRAGYLIAGWPTPMDTVTVDLRPAYAYQRDGSGFEPRIRTLVRLERDDLLWTYSKGMVEGGYNYLALEAYTSYGPRATLGFTTPIRTERLQFRVGWGIESLDFRDISPLLDPTLRTELALDDTARIGNYQQAVTIDLRDNPLATTYGLFGELRVAEGTRYAAGDFDYVQVIPELRGFLPVVGGLILAGRARYGRFYGDVPATERFFSGGAANHRGFGERKLSPFVQGEEVMGEGEIYVPYGGAELVETSVEARIPITTWRKMGIGTVLFLDGGDVVDDSGQLELGRLHWAVGTGLRLNTIVGPIRADLGYRLNRTGPMDPAPGSRFAFHFSIGEAF